MKVLVLCNNDLASLFAVNLLLPGISGNQIVLGLSSHVGSQQEHPIKLQRLIEFEKTIALNLDSQIAQQLFDPIMPTKRCRIFKSFEQLAKNVGNQLLSLNHINSHQGLKLVSGLSPELILTIRFGKILQQPIIDIPKLGVINLHSGLLPKYQGIMATFWAMLKKEPKIGCCLHYIQDKRIDAGDIIQQSPVSADYSASYLQNLLAIYIPGIKMMAQAVSQLQQRKSLVAKVQQGRSGYYGFPDNAAIDCFLKLGYQLF